ncbi:hypothetical protein EH165_12790 [Nakamurella antarctica]|uniref:Uncharacterized protein n=1 Tax=Nakamurella antarctica TaxID=1902245 RepID=A0A3G8ZY00_9ACTN|nr:hypothetical protein [Nakamurella antarctica]AZI58886.1 hypothetical protein EH165_12790 [Nakamurella antarctica]
MTSPATIRWTAAKQRSARRVWVAMTAVALLTASACGSEVSGNTSTEGGATSPGTISSPAAPTSQSPATESSSTDPSSSETPPSDEPNSGTPTSSPSDDGSGVPPKGGEGQTQPGATLSLTDTATLRSEFAGDAGIFTYTDFKIVQGTVEDWFELGVDSTSVVGLVPWYVTVTIKQEEGALAFAYANLESDIRPVTDLGEMVLNAGGYGERVGCLPAFYNDGYVLGDSYTTCSVWKVSETEKIAGLTWTGGYDGPYYENPVKWVVG